MTTQAQQDPAKLIDKLIAYILQVRRLRRKHEYSDSDIVAMDETPVWQDMLSDTTVDTTGEPSIRMENHRPRKSQNLRLSCCESRRNKAEANDSFQGREARGQKAQWWVQGQMYCCVIN